jgi:hypothetical protein
MAWMSNDGRRQPLIWWGIEWALEMNKIIFSAHKQILGARMRWPAVPLIINKSIVYDVYRELTLMCVSAETFARTNHESSPWEMPTR